MNAATVKQAMQTVNNIFGQLPAEAADADASLVNWLADAAQFQSSVEGTDEDSWTVLLFDHWAAVTERLIKAEATVDKSGADNSQTFDHKWALEWLTDWSVDCAKFRAELVAKAA